MIGKAERGPAAIEAISKHKAAYLMAVGGAAYLVSKAIKQRARCVGFADLGMEAIYEFDVRDMPVTVAVDAQRHQRAHHRPGRVEQAHRHGRVQEDSCRGGLNLSGTAAATRAPVESAVHGPRPARSGCSTAAWAGSASCGRCAPSCRGEDFVYFCRCRAMRPMARRASASSPERSLAIAVDLLRAASHQGTGGRLQHGRPRPPCTCCARSTRRLPVVGVEPALKPAAALDADRAHRRAGHARHAGQREIPRLHGIAEGPGRVPAGAVRRTGRAPSRRTTADAGSRAVRTRYTREACCFGTAPGEIDTRGAGLHALPVRRRTCCARCSGPGCSWWRPASRWRAQTPRWLLERRAQAMLKARKDRPSIGCNGRRRSVRRPAGPGWKAATRSTCDGSVARDVGLPALAPRASWRAASNIALMPAITCGSARLPHGRAHVDLQQQRQADREHARRSTGWPARWLPPVAQVIAP